jgi:hypothetical protein
MKLDEEIDKMYMLKQRKKGLEDQIKEVVAKIGDCELNLLTRFKEVGTNTARGDLASATITESLVPRIEDWGEVSDWIMANDAIYLCHRRVSSGPWKELIDSGETVPGIVPFTKTAISLRKRGD